MTTLNDVGVFPPLFSACRRRLARTPACLSVGSSLSFSFWISHQPSKDNGSDVLPLETQPGCCRIFQNHKTFFNKIGGLLLSLVDRGSVTRSCHKAKAKDNKQMSQIFDFSHSIFLCTVRMLIYSVFFWYAAAVVKSAMHNERKATSKQSIWFHVTRDYILIAVWLSIKKSARRMTGDSR